MSAQPDAENPLPGAVTVRRHGEHVAIVTLDRPPSNALDHASLTLLSQHLEELDADLSVRCIVLTGARSVFTAGADLREESSAAGTQVLRGFDRLLRGIEGARVPVVAALNGATVGGGLEVALACDIRIASERAFLTAAGVNVGLIANFWRLIRLCGLGVAKEILLTGERIDATRALTWGLVTQVHPHEDLLPSALATAERIASRAPLSVEATKRAANLAPELDRASAEAIQVAYMKQVAASTDHREAVDAFLARRTPNFVRA